MMRLPAKSESVKKLLLHWKQDKDLASIRDAKDLPTEFKALWAEVDALLKEASK